MQMASSANLTCSELRSASLYTATVRMPSSLQALITRSAISPRLAIRTLRSMGKLDDPDSKQRLAVLDGLAIVDQALHNLACSIGFNLVHQLHRFHDAHHLALFDVIAVGNKRRRARRRRLIERADDRRLDNVQILRFRSF